MQRRLPIEDFLLTISESLSNFNNLLLVAEPGSGKTTRVAPYLLSADWLKKKKILMLEPRRLAAKAAANFIASEMGEITGESVGYAIRGESKRSPKTRLEIITEGLLTRIIQEDPGIEDVGLVIFDEFHERSIHADLALALVLDSKKHLRPDLRIMVMSATLDTDAVSKVLGDSQIINCPGKQYPVEIVYKHKPGFHFIEDSLIELIKHAYKDDEGDILVFLPGRAEIHRLNNKLKNLSLFGSSQILNLHSEIRGEEQDRILSPRNNDPRRIILSTNVAETSVTIPRVRIVIDSGLMRVPRFNPSRGVAGLETVPVSLASAVQRSGRAGREGPGKCYRLWSEAEEKGFQKFNQPEMIYSDLSPFLLELAAWGDINPLNYRLITTPPQNNLSQARELLSYLGATDDQGAITAHGRSLLKLAAPPRISHMIILAKEIGAGKRACELAAVLQEPSSTQDKDLDCILSNRLENLKTNRTTDEARRLYEILGRPTDNNPDISNGTLIAFAYPDRIAKQREKGGNRYLLRNGTGAIARQNSVFCRYEYIAIAELDGLGDNSRIFLGESLKLEEIREYFRNEIIRSREISWNEKELTVRAREIESLSALILSEKPVSCSDEEAQPVIIEALKKNGISILPLNEECCSLINRLKWLRAKDEANTFPDFEDDFLLRDIDNWLLPYLSGIRSIHEIKPETILLALKLRLTRDHVKLLEELAPSHFNLPSGRAAPISYDGPRAPSISGKLQEMFGQAFTPKILKGQIPLTIELLSPAGRPLQVTSDLESFWNNSYQEVRKEMSGRYPKHSWPLNPKDAIPTRGIKKR